MLVFGKMCTQDTQAQAHRRLTLQATSLFQQEYRVFLALYPVVAVVVVVALLVIHLTTTPFTLLVAVAVGQALPTLMLL
jgi:hypothetical protein